MHKPSVHQNPGFWQTQTPETTSCHHCRSSWHFGEDPHPQPQGSHSPEFSPPDFVLFCSDLHTWNHSARTLLRRHCAAQYLMSSYCWVTVHYMDLTQFSHSLNSHRDCPQVDYYEQSCCKHICNKSFLDMGKRHFISHEQIPNSTITAS